MWIEEPAEGGRCVGGKVRCSDWYPVCVSGPGMRAEHVRGQHFYVPKSAKCSWPIVAV